jgi:hypothetical protein
MPKPDRTKEKTPAASTAEVLDAKTPNIEFERTKPMNSIPTPSASGQLIPVMFGGDTLVLADQNGQPYVVMRPLVSAMGLDWRSQHVKITEKFRSTVVEITTVAEDGKPRTMICLPLRKLPGWLYSINPGKVAPALRAKIVRFQEECDEVLWRHWSGTYVPQHSVAHVSLSRLALSYEREHTRVCLELARCTELGLGAALFDKYQRLCGLLGALVVDLDTLAPALRQKRLALEGGAA